MSKARQDQEPERRIHQEIVADPHDAQEQAMGYYYYLQEQLRFPFAGTCTATREISPLHKGQKVNEVELAPSEKCEREMFLLITWEVRTLAVPLAQFKALQSDKVTGLAIADWR